MGCYRHACPHQAGGLFGHAQNNGVALDVGHGGIGLPKTAGHATAHRFEFGVDALGAGLQGGEKVKLAHEPIQFHKEEFQSHQSLDALA